MNKITLLRLSNPRAIIGHDYLLVQWETSTHTEEEKEDGDPMVRVVQRAVATVREGAPGCLSRAAKQLQQLPPAPLTAATIDQLHTLHPAPTEPMPPLPKDHRTIMPELVTVDQKALLRLLQRRINNGSAPGPSGWTGAHLQLIAERGTKQAIDGLCALIQDLCNGVFDGDLKQRLLSCTLMPIWKKGVGSGIRPIAIGEVFPRLAAHYQMSLIADELPRLFSKIQYGVSRPGGSEAAAQVTRALIEECARHHPTAVAIATDAKNAFNQTSRAKMWRTLMAHPSTQPIWRYVHWCYGEESPLLLFERDGHLHTVLRSREGARQGDPLASFLFALSMQRLYEEIIEGLPDCHAVAVLDDLTLIGPSEQVLQAFDRMKNKAPEYSLELQVAKCQAYLPPTAFGTVVPAVEEEEEEERQRATRARVHSACASAGLQCVPRLEALGVTFGTNDDIEAELDDIVSSHTSFFEAITHAKMPTQVGYALLRQCALPRLGFLARTTRPHLIRAAAERFDAMVLHHAERLLDIGERSRSLLPSEMITNDQLVERISLPISLGGLGLRPFTRVSHAAYFSSLAQALPDICAAIPKADQLDSAVHADLLQCRADLLPTLELVKMEKSLQQIHKDAHHWRSVAGSRGHAHRSYRSTVESKAPVSSDVRRRHCSTHSVHDSMRWSHLLSGEHLDVLWATANQAAASRMATPTYLQRVHLQHELTRNADRQLYEKHYRASSHFQRTILTSINLNANTHAWLLASPTSPAHRMRNDTFRLAVRHRLGLPAYDSLLESEPRGMRKGLSCHGKGRCSVTNARLETDPHHLHSCVFSSGDRTSTQRSR
ncbi:MAG: reverse transcriptase domain-containing protein [Chthoniobacter sp.]|nr:reverse transcriptase domain-containing protein [Chthoniobacter sp.]